METPLPTPVPKASDSAAEVLRWCGVLGHPVVTLDADGKGGLRSRLHCNTVDEAKKEILDGGYEAPQIWVRDGKTRDGRRKWKQIKLSVAERLRAHLASDGATANDGETDELYREAHRFGIGGTVGVQNASVTEASLPFPPNRNRPR